MTHYHAPISGNIARKFCRRILRCQMPAGEYNPPMAKAQKTDKKIEAKKPAAKKSSAPAGTPMVDTNLAANAAAAMIGNKAPAAAQGQQQPRKESSAFK